MTTVEVTLNTPLAEALSSAIQPKLAEVGWSSGGVDDSALSEYIILMLVNGKTQDQIAAELSGDLLNLGPDDPDALEFSRWLFEQVGLLNSKLNDGAALKSNAIPTSEVQGQGQDQSQAAGSAEQDTEMGGSAETATSSNIPTGPKSMRGGPRNKRLIGQLSRAMDRSSENVLHRVRPQQGTERINSHSREPPKGPRNAQNRGPRMLNGRNAGTMPPGGMMNGGPHGAMMNMSPQQQMQLFAMYEEQARMMSQILSPQQQQQIFIPPNMGGSAANGGFGNGFQGAPTVPQRGRSLFERAEAKPQRQAPHFNKHQKGSGNRDHKMDTDHEMGDDTSSMDADASQSTRDGPPEATTCKFNLACTKQECPFAHQSPAAPPGTSIDVTDNCPFGAACKNKKCVARHPSPAVKATHQAEQECKFFPNCTNTSCPFRHPSIPLCRNGADCKRADCKFTHVKTMCKYNPCLNPLCAFKHADGQKRGAFKDKVWTAEGGKEREHVSERKFVDENGEEELIIPTSDSGQSTAIPDAELIT